VADPTNDDPVHRRNRVRHEVLPLLDDVADRDVVPLLVRLADHARAAAEALDDEATALDPTDARALAVARPVVAQRAVRAWLRAGSPDGQPPDLATVERVLAVARGEAIATDVGAGRRVARSAQRLRVEPAAPIEPRPGRAAGADGRRAPPEPASGTAVGGDRGARGGDQAEPTR
jgi:tRNA(Ile)-lysidine synthase